MTDVPFVQNRAEEKWAQGTKDRRRGDRLKPPQQQSHRRSQHPWSKGTSSKRIKIRTNHTLPTRSSL